MSRSKRLEALEEKTPSTSKVTRIERPIKELDGTIVEKFVRTLQPSGSWSSHFEKLIDSQWIKTD